MTYIKNIFILVLLLFISNKTFSQVSVIQDNEELYYEVYYSFIKIGWVKFNNELTDAAINKYRSTAVLRSNESLPFVDVNFEFVTDYLFKENKIVLLSSVQKEFKDEKVSTQVYTFNQDSGYVTLYKTGYDGSVHFDKKFPLDKNYQDGLSIFYTARIGSVLKNERIIPVLINDDSSSVRINYLNEKDETDIDDIDYDVSSLKINGFANFKAVFGLTGEFTGFFSNDIYRIPLKANLEVQIGKITLELKSWKVNKWKPPKA